LAILNKRFFNEAEIEKGTRPVLTHVGRNSGKAYQVPLAAQSVKGGYLFTLRYGAGSDWVKNVFAAGTARLRVGDEEVELGSPRLVSKGTADELLGAEGAPTASQRRAIEFLQMETAG
jgi:deazaflavin-dependent oxidoreductase (nitroreductase family)